MLVRNSWCGTSISPFASAFEFYLTAGGLAAIVKNLVQRDGIGVILEIEGAGLIGSFNGRHGEVSYACPNFSRARSLLDSNPRFTTNCEIPC